MKMKNYQGTALSSVRNAMWRVFGAERLPPLRSNASAADVIQWKQSQPVIAAFDSLFQQNAEGVFWITAIARAAFSETAVPNITSTHCAFTLAVCDILLNPQSKGTVCTEKRIKRRMARYIVSYQIFVCNRFITDS